jgi:hypothetical protein
MQLTRRPAFLLATLVVLVAAWSALQAGQSEIVVMRTFDGKGEDLFTTLWVVDDSHGFAWIRANRPDRKWLPLIAEGQTITLRRDGRTQRYVARVFDDEPTRAKVAALFRQTYGLADRWREWAQGSDTIPIRLQPQ